MGINKRKAISENDSHEVRTKDISTRRSVRGAASGEKVRNRHCVCKKEISVGEIDDKVDEEVVEVESW